MGYTHYYEVKCEDEDKFAEMYLESSLIVEHANREGKVCSFVVDHKRKLFVIEGVGKDTCEPFVWSPKKAKSFCKTARLPYDAVVAACLIVAYDIYGEQVSIGSDGEWDDWDLGKKLYESTFGRSPMCPFEEYSDGELDD